jgi:hypothetical protein
VEKELFWKHCEYLTTKREADDKAKRTFIKGRGAELKRVETRKRRITIRKGEKQKEEGKQ